jgi:hypothetical protein
MIVTFDLVTESEICFSSSNITTYVGIEYEAIELSEMDGIGATKKLLETVRDKLSGD